MGGYRPHVQLLTNQFNWEDIRVPVSSLRLLGSGDPTATAYRGGSVLAFPTNANATIYFIVQLPHAWREGTNLDTHIHWTIDANGAAGGAENVGWVFTYSWANMGDAMPTESNDTTTIDVSNSTADIHTYTDLVELSGTGKLISSMIICSLMRDVSVANDYGGNALLFEVDFHYQRARAGTYNEGATP